MQDRRRYFDETSLLWFLSAIKLQFDPDDHSSTAVNAIKSSHWIWTPGPSGTVTFSCSL